MTNELTMTKDEAVLALLLSEILPDYAPHWHMISQDERLRLAHSEADCRAEVLKEASDAVYEAEKKFDRAIRLIELI